MPIISIASTIWAESTANNCRIGWKRSNDKSKLLYNQVAGPDPACGDTDAGAGLMQNQDQADTQFSPE